MRCHKNITLVYIMVKLVLLYVILLKVAETIDDVTWRLTVQSLCQCGWQNQALGRHRKK